MPRIWRTVPGMPMYQVTDRGGLVRSIKHLKDERSIQKHGSAIRIKLLKRYLCGGMVMVGIFNPITKRPEAIGVGRLVLMTFDRMPEPGEVARHYHDPNPWVLDARNLQWGTRKDNEDDRTRHNDGINPKTQISAETRAKIAAKLRGRKLKEETKRKISQSCTGKKHTEESKRKISEAHRNKIVSEESRQRMSEAQRKRFAEIAEMKKWWSNREHS